MGSQFVLDYIAVPRILIRLEPVLAPGVERIMKSSMQRMHDLPDESVSLSVFRLFFGGIFAFDA